MQVADGRELGQGDLRLFELVDLGEYGLELAAALRAEGLALGQTRDLRQQLLIEVVAEGTIVFTKADVTIEDGKLWKSTFGK